MPSAAPTATFAPTPAPLKTPVELVIPGTAAASNATPAVLNVTCLCDVEENKTVTCPDNSTQHFWCNGMPGEHSLVCGSTTSGCATCVKQMEPGENGLINFVQYINMMLSDDRRPAKEAEGGTRASRRQSTKR